MDRLLGPPTNNSAITMLDSLATSSMGSSSVASSVVSSALVTTSPSFILTAHDLSQAFSWALGVWLTGPVYTVICTAFIPTRLKTPVPATYRIILTFPLCLCSADPGIMAPVPGPMVNVDTVTAVRSVKESIPALTVPFGPQRHLLSPHGPLPLHGKKRQQRWDHDRDPHLFSEQCTVMLFIFTFT